MHRIKKYKVTALLLTIILIFGVSAQATLAYITAQSNDIVNTFVPIKDMNISVKGEKILEGREWQEGDRFEFILTKLDESGKALDEAATSAAYNAEGNYSFSFSEAIKDMITEEGTHSFRITEKKGNDDTIKYSNDEYRFTVTAEEDDITKALVITEADIGDLSNDNAKAPTITHDEENNTFDINVEFANVYTAPPVVVEPEPVKVQVNIDKKMEYMNDDEGEKIGSGGFLFTLEEDSELDDKHSIRTDNEGKASFVLEYDKEDIDKTYIYELKEIDEALDGVDYSEEEYEVRIAITKTNDNKLTAEIICDGKTKDTFEFTNVYDCGIGGGDEPTEPTEPSDPSKPDEPTEPSSPADQEEEQTTTGQITKDDGSKTGDDTNMILPVIILITSEAIIAIILADRRRRKA